MGLLKNIQWKELRKSFVKKIQWYFIVLISSPVWIKHTAKEVGRIIADNIQEKHIDK